MYRVQGAVLYTQKYNTRSWSRENLGRTEMVEQNFVAHGARVAKSYAKGDGTAKI